MCNLLEGKESLNTYTEFSLLHQPSSSVDMKGHLSLLKQWYNPYIIYSHIKIIVHPMCISLLIKMYFKFFVAEVEISHNQLINSV